MVSTRRTTTSSRRLDSLWEVMDCAFRGSSCKYSCVEMTSVAQDSATPWFAVFFGLNGIHTVPLRLFILPDSGHHSKSKAGITSLFYLAAIVLKHPLICIAICSSCSLAHSCCTASCPSELRGVGCKALWLLIFPPPLVCAATPAEKPSNQ